MQNKIWVLISYAVVLCVCPFFLFALKCRLLWLCHIQWFGSYACVAMHIVAEWEYLLGTMSTGIPRECLINVWLGILHRLVHIPTQFVSSKNLQGVGLMAKIPSAIKTLMMIIAIMMVMMEMEKERALKHQTYWSRLIYQVKCLRLVTCMG